MSIRTLRLLFPSALLLLGAGALAQPAGAGVFTWSWDPSAPGARNDAGGSVNWIHSEFDSATEQLSWTVNLGGGGSPQTGGFTLALSDGVDPRGRTDLALLYFDATRVFAPEPGANEAVLSVYGSNGKLNATSYRDGSYAAGLQAPDRIASSLAAGSDSWVHELNATEESDGSRTFGFSIDAGAIRGHVPLYGSSWYGTGMDAEVGAWLHTFAGLGTAYDDEWLSAWSRPNGSEGYLSLAHRDTDPTNPVPEPATLTLLGIGTMSLFGLRRRRARQATAVE